MRKQLVCLLLLVLLFPTSALSQKTRSAAYAGQFYDRNPRVLAGQIKAFLDSAEKKVRKTGKLRVLIVPHAGYSCSGAVAATAYKQVQGFDYKTVVIIGPSHRVGIQGCSIYLEGGYETPLGTAQIDKTLAQDIARDSGFGFFPSAHRAEHSIEVQVPFIQTVLPQAKIIPILMGLPNRDTVFSLAESLIRTISDSDVLVVVSTDLSHYYTKSKANKIDANTLDLIKRLDTEVLLDKLQRGENIMCGGGGVVSSLLFTKSMGPATLDLLQYADSSMTCGPASEVVGYAAAALYSESTSQEEILTEEGKEELLRLARTSIRNFLRKKRSTAYTPENSELLLERGAFVTLKKDGALRGCIGFSSPVAPLYQTIIQASVFAAVRDTRFDPVTLAELRDLEIEISVLSPLEQIHNPLFIEVGKHGLFISKNNQSGLLLPQVPVENNWTRLTFLEQACLKAGLPKDAWKSGANLFIFTATVFHE